MATPVTVGRIRDNKHTTDQYAIITMRMLGLGQDTSKPAIALVTQEVHIVKGLQANILVSTDIMLPEQMDVLFSQNTLAVGSCRVGFPIRAQVGSTNAVHQIVHSKSTVSIPPQSAAIVLIH